MGILPLKARFVQRYKLLAAALILAAPLSPAMAGPTGRITEVSNSNAGNYSFRVFLDSGVAGCTYNFAFINTSDDNYQAKVSTLLTAFSLGKTVQLTTSVVAGNFCQISDINVLG